MQYCPHCMQPTSGEYCTNCGGQVNWKAPATQLPLGTLLRGSSSHVYQIGAAKGQGGFGITYAALDLMTNVRVAIKEYYPTRCAVRDHMNNVIPATGQQETYQGGMHSFLEEAKTLSAVGALPSVVSIRDYFEANGTAYLVMEYVEGDALHQVVQKSGPMSEETLMPMLKDLMRDLAILHRAGVIHRDISPDNLILTPQNTLKLLDFGAARSVQDGKSMTVMLKAGFSPVEQYQSKGQGPYTDVYALAGTVYYCLTGKLPPTAIDRITEDELVPPSKLGARIGKGREEALLWGLTVQPTARPQNMDIFSNAMFPQKVPNSTDSVKKPERQVLFNTETGEPLDPNAKIPNSRIPTSHIPASRVPTSHIPASHIPSSQVPNSQVPNSQVPNSQIPGGASGIVSGGSKSKPGGKNKGLFIGIGAAAAVLVAVVITLVMLLSGGTTDDGYQYRLSGGEAHISGFEGSGSVLTVPSTVKDKKVVTIREGAFTDLKSVTEITIPESVTTVEAGAFANLPKLEVVNILGKSTQVEKGAFEGCKSLRCIFVATEKGYNTLTGGNALKGMDDVGVCYLGQSFSGGTVQSVRVTDGIPYAITDRNQAIMLAQPGDVSDSELPAFVEGMRIFDTKGVRVGAVVGTTEDGFEYEIFGEEVIIVNYVGDENVVGLPADVDGKPITQLAAGTFTNNSVMETLFLTASLERIELGAIVNCSNLRSIYVYSDMTVPAGTIVNCPKLRCVMENYCSVENWSLPADCKVVKGFSETGAGKLFIVDVDDQGIIYGMTDSDEVVLLSLPAGISEFNIPKTVMGGEVTWTDEHALDDVTPETVINMAPTMGFPFELMDKADWEFYGLGDFSHNWLMSCVVCQEINEARPSGAPKIYPDRLVVEGATIRARELSASNSHTRPNGSKWSTVLNDVGADWYSARAFKDSLSMNTDTFTDDYTDLLWELVEAFTDKNDSGKYYVRFGAALYVNNGKNLAFCNAIAVVLE